MRRAHISRRQAEASFDGLDFTEDDVLAFQEDAVRSTDLLGLDDLLDDVDRDLVMGQYVATVRVSRAFTDPRRARRANRRADRAALSALPTRYGGDQSEAA